MAKLKKQEETVSTKSKAQRVQEWAAPKVDWIAKMAAGLFFIATSYGYIAAWLKAHQSYNLSVAGGILVVSVALYLYTRKR